LVSDIFCNNRLIAIMLGVFRMTIAQCIEEWEELAPSIFPNKTSKVSRLAISSAGNFPYSERALEIAINGLVEKYIGDRASPGKVPLLAFEAMADRKSPLCKVYVKPDTYSKIHTYVRAYWYYY
jgi:hypothetical protein